jgi:hypothetical protein
MFDSGNPQSEFGTENGISGIGKNVISSRNRYASPIAEMLTCMTICNTATLNGQGESDDLAEASEDNKKVIG